jgi:hypothetical protein
MSKPMPKMNLNDLYDTYKTHSGVFRYLSSLPEFQHPDSKPNYFKIGKFTGKRVQHVRNVLVTPLTGK